MLDYLVEDGVLFLLKFPVSNISGSQPRWLSTNGSFLGNSLTIRIGS